jgi:hypothetical protein
MVHLHYSPFQFATDVQVSDHRVGVKKVVAKLTKMTARDKLPPPKLMSCDEAKSIPGTPTAFISPNPVDVMRTAKSVFGN